jgi:hypothetical protein
MTRVTISVLFQSDADGTLLVMAHSYRFNCLPQ